MIKNKILLFLFFWQFPLCIFSQEEAIKIINAINSGSLYIFDNQLKCILGYDNEYEVSLEKFTRIDVFFLVGHISDSHYVQIRENDFSSRIEDCHAGIIYAKIVEKVVHGFFLCRRLAGSEESEINTEDLLQLEVIYMKWVMENYEIICDKSAVVPDALEGSRYYWTDCSP